MKINVKNKFYGLIALTASFFVLALFFLFGLILAIFFLQNLFMGISGFGLVQALYALIGAYLTYKASKNTAFLIKNRNNFNKILFDFANKNSNAVIITTVLSIILLALHYSGISSNFDFFINIILYLPIFVLENLAFIVNIFLLRYNLLFLTPLADLILPISEVLFLYTISGYIAKLLKRK